VCGERFNSVYAFDLHRVGSFAPMARRCLTADEMLAAGYSRNIAGFWISAPRLDRTNFSRFERDPIPGVRV
jgi:hypothetical protein